MKNQHKNHAKGNTDKTKHIPQREKLKHEIEIRERVDLTERQKQFIDLALDSKCKIMFVSGPAGTSKSWISVLCALKLLKEKKISDIVYVRSAVESADAKLGFLPGEANDKMAPYIQPLLDKLEELLSKHDIEHLIKEQRVSGLPIGFLRGLSWNAKAIISDECIDGRHYVQSGDGSWIQISSLYYLFIKNKEMPLLKTYNESTRAFENKKIEKVICKGTKAVINVRLDNGKSICCTPEHKFLTLDGWIEAKDLTADSSVVSNGTILRVKRITDKHEKKMVYDITMADNHNFILLTGKVVNKNEEKNVGIVAHNCQNMSKKELVTLITRLGQFSKMFILGDPYQSDINGRSGFMPLFNLFNDEESKNNGVYCFEFTKDDIVRSGLIKYILEKLEKGS